MDKENVIYTYSGILFSLKIPLFVTRWMEEDIMLREISQIQGKKKNILHDLTYMWTLKQSNSEKQRVEWWLPGVKKEEKLER